MAKKLADAIEEFVSKYGEKHRRVITDSLTWLEKEEPTWGLSKPINKTTFIRELISHIKY